jgi:hypothetical protein
MVSPFRPIPQFLFKIAAGKRGPIRSIFALVSFGLGQFLALIV